MSKKKPNKLVSIFRWFVLLFPAVLYFSYFPVISFGANETMNFELSLPLIWLVVFDVVSLVLMIQKKVLFTGVKKYWWILLFPVWTSLTVAWSLNFVRGMLVAGIIWLILFAVYGLWKLRGELGEEFRLKFLKWFIISTIIVCGWCVIQCVLDIIGVSSDYTLLCAGCTYSTFGFPHPNGFAAEPQFMGNLLLAPGLITAWLYLRKLTNRKIERKRSRGVVFTTAKSDSARYCSTDSSSVAVVKTTTGSCFLCSIFLLVSFFIIIMTLFLTLSRGAIYSFVVAFVVMTIVVVAGLRQGKKDFIGLKKLGMVWGVIVLSFLFALNLQGLMAEMSKTDDTYVSGVSKVINQLTLGKVDIGGTEVKKIEPEVVVTEDEEFEKSDFDGYVEVSTNVRLDSSRVALEVWSKDLRTALFGAGLGSASILMYQNEMFSTPKEIINNQYISLLLETGVIGILLMVLMVVLVARLVLARCDESMMIMTVMVAYLVSLCFFSGLPNALQIYLITELLIALFGTKKLEKRKRD